MINLVDTVRNVVGDKYAMIKILILTIPVVIATYAQLSGQTALSNIINIAFGIVFSAIFFETIRRSCTAEPMLLPPFMLPFRMFLTLLLTIVAAIPIVAVCVGLFFGYIQVLVKYFPTILQSHLTLRICNFIVSIIITALFFSSVTQFLDTGKVLDAYNPVKVFKALNTFIINMILFIIQDMIFIVIAILLPAYIIIMLAGMEWTNFFVILWLSMGFVINYLVFADYVGQTKKDSEVC